MCFGNLKGDRMQDIDATQPARQISIVGSPSPAFSNDPSGANQKILSENAQNAHDMHKNTRTDIDVRPNGEMAGDDEAAKERRKKTMGSYGGYRPAPRMAGPVVGVSNMGSFCDGMKGHADGLQ